LRLEPSERGKVVDALSSLPTWGGGNIEGLTLVAGRWEPSLAVRRSTWHSSTPRCNRRPWSTDDL
jgi:hypothetical protein